MTVPLVGVHGRLELKVVVDETGALTQRTLRVERLSAPIDP